MNPIPSIALAGMNASQTALAVAGHNIANLAVFNAADRMTGSPFDALG